MSLQLVTYDQGDHLEFRFVLRTADVECIVDVEPFTYDGSQWRALANAVRQRTCHTLSFCRRGRRHCNSREQLGVQCTHDHVAFVCSTPTCAAEGMILLKLSLNNHQQTLAQSFDAIAELCDNRDKRSPGAV